MCVLVLVRVLRTHCSVAIAIMSRKCNIPYCTDKVIGIIIFVEYS